MTKHQFHFYTMAWMDLIEGSSILDIKGAMKMYANIEKFDACIGIQKAINEYNSHITLLKKLKIKSNDKK